MAHQDISTQYKKEIDQCVVRYFNNKQNLKDIATSDDVNGALYDIVNKLVCNFEQKHHIDSKNDTHQEIYNLFGTKIAEEAKKYHSEDFNYLDYLYLKPIQNTINTVLETFKRLANKNQKASEDILDPIYNMLNSVPKVHIGINHMKIALMYSRYDIAEYFVDAKFNIALSHINNKVIEYPLSSKQHKEIDDLLNIYYEFSNHIKNKVRSAYLNSIKEDIDQIQAIFDKNEAFLNKKALTDNKHNKSDISNNLLESDARFIKLYTKYSEGEWLSKEQKRYIQIMLDKSISDKAFNKRLGAFLKEKNNFSLTKYEDASKELRAFSYKTRNFSKIDQIIKKATNNIALIQSGEKIDSFDKLSQFEFGALHEIVKLQDMMEDYMNDGLIADKSKLNELNALCSKASHILESIDEILISEGIYKPGDILMQHSKKSLASKNKAADKEAKLTNTLISKFDHTAQIYLREDGMPMLSHIVGKYYGDDKVKSQNITTAYIFRIDPSKLVSQENAEKLQELYGDKWKEQLQSKLQNIFEDIHTQYQKRFDIIENDYDARYQAGRAKFGFHGGHKEKQQKDLAVERDKLLGRSGHSIKKTMICSEFVMKTTLAALIELNDKLNEELGIEEQETNIINMPISSKERLQHIHPQRLIDLLNKAGCIERVEQHNMLKELVSQERLYGYEKSRDIANDLYNKMNQLAGDKNIDEEEFINRGKNIFHAYMKSENIGANIKQEDVDNYLNTTLKQFKKEYDKRHPESFAGKFQQILSNFAEWIGVKENKSKIVIQNTMKHIDQELHEQRQKDSLSHGKYK